MAHNKTLPGLALISALIIAPAYAASVTVTTPKPPAPAAAAPANNSGTTTGESNPSKKTGE